MSRLICEMPQNTYELFDIEQPKRLGIDYELYSNSFVISSIHPSMQKGGEGLLSITLAGLLSFSENIHNTCTT